VDVTDGTQRYAVENNRVNSTTKRDALAMLQRLVARLLTASG